MADLTLSDTLASLAGGSSYNPSSTDFSSVPDPTKPPDIILAAANVPTQVPASSQIVPTPSAKIQGLAPTSSSNLGLPSSQNIIQQVNDKIKALNSAVDIPSLSAGLADIKGSVEGVKADFYKQAQSEAMVKYGIPKLEQQIRQSEMIDKRNPYVVASGMDSTETAAMREQLARLRNIADAGINDSLRGNAVYQTLNGSLDTAEKVAQSMLIRQLQRDQNSEAAVELKKQQVTDKFNSFTPTQQSMIVQGLGLNPSDPDVAAKAIFRISSEKGANGKMLQDLVERGPRAVPLLTLDKNPFATNIALAQETNAANGDATQAQAKISLLQDISSENKVAEKKWNEMVASGFNPQIDSGIDPKKGLSLLKVGDKGDNTVKEETANFRKQVATVYAKWMTRKNFDGDILSIPKGDVPIPAFLQAAKNDPKINANGKISRDQAITLANSASTFQERQKNIQDLVSYYNQGVGLTNRSMFFTISPLAPDELKARAQLQGIIPALGNTISGMLDDYSAFGKKRNPNPPTPSSFDLKSTLFGENQ